MVALPQTPRAVHVLVLQVYSLLQLSLPSTLQVLHCMSAAIPLSLGHVSCDFWGDSLLLFLQSPPLPKPQLSLIANSNRKLDQYVPIFLTRSLHTGWKLFLVA